MFVCTANQCRSPMAKGLYRQRAKACGCSPEVASAGFLPGGVPVPEEVLEVMAARGVDLDRHRSRILTPDLVLAADLVLTMTRQQLLDLAVQVESAWTRCFTLTEAVRRAEVIGPPDPGGDPSSWVRRLHAGRDRASLLRLDGSEDIEDPMQGRRSAYRRAADQIDDLVTRLVAVVCAADPAA